MIALMLPTYERLADLTKVLEETPLTPAAKFIVVAHYDPAVYQSLVAKYSDRAVFLDERAYGKLGGCKAYNLAYSKALELGFDYAIHYADDVLPADPDWLDRIDEQVIRAGHVFAVFSSDECHYGSFGWNIIQDTPIAHFYVMKCGLFGKELFDPRFRQYAIDLDLAVQVLAAGHRILLMPVRLRHYRSPLNRQNVKANYEYDVSVFYERNPRFAGFLETEAAQRYIPETGQSIVLPTPDLQGMLQPWPAHTEGPRPGAATPNVPAPPTGPPAG